MLSKKQQKEAKSKASVNKSNYLLLEEIWNKYKTEVKLLSNDNKLITKVIGVRGYAASITSFTMYDERVIIDAGFLPQKETIPRIIAITHGHSDHSRDIMNRIQLKQINGYPITILTPHGTGDYIFKMIQANLSFQKNQNYIDDDKNRVSNNIKIIEFNIPQDTAKQKTKKTQKTDTKEGTDTKEIYHYGKKNIQDKDIVEKYEMDDTIHYFDISKENEIYNDIIGVKAFKCVHTVPSIGYVFYYNNPEKNFDYIYKLKIVKPAELIEPAKLLELKVNKHKKIIDDYFSKKNENKDIDIIKGEKDATIKIKEDYEKKQTKNNWILDYVDDVEHIKRIYINKNHVGSKKTMKLIVFFDLMRDRIESERTLIVDESKRILTLDDLLKDVFYKNSDKIKIGSNKPSTKEKKLLQTYFSIKDKEKKEILEKYFKFLKEDYKKEVKISRNDNGDIKLNVNIEEYTIRSDEVIECELNLENIDYIEYVYPFRSIKNSSKKEKEKKELQISIEKLINPADSVVKKPKEKEKKKIKTIDKLIKKIDDIKKSPEYDRGIEEDLDKIKSNLNRILNDDKNIDQMKEIERMLKNYNITGTINKFEPFVMFFGDTSAKVFENKLVKKYLSEVKHVFIECTYIDDSTKQGDIKKKAEDNKHMMFSEIYDNAKENKDIQFYLHHFSKKYTKEDINKCINKCIRVIEKIPEHIPVVVPDNIHIW